MKKLYFFLPALFIVVLFTGSTLIAKEKFSLYRTVLEQEIVIVSDNVNVRTGPGLQYPVTKVVNKDDTLEVLGALGSWYVVYLDDGSIGVVATEFVKVSKLGDRFITEGDGESKAASAGVNAEADRNSDVETLFALVNASRMENNLPPYGWDEKLNRVAVLKAEDMVQKKYFGHYSEAYGTPFQMLKQMEIPYKSASENVAGNLSVENAHLKIMSMPANRANILNTRFTKMGIGVVASKEYGNIIVQLFVED